MVEGGNQGMNKGGKKSNEDDKLKDEMLNTIVAEKPNVKWDDVAGLT